VRRRGLSRAQMMQAGLSPRQLEWWTRKGWLRTYDVSPGSGNSRTWHPGEDHIARLMIRFVKAGVSPESACLAARGLPLAPGVTLAVDSELVGRSA
jgi:hypothetical protein